MPTRNPTVSHHRISPILLAILLLALAGGRAAARSGGIDGYSGNPATNGGSICNACHSGGQTPQVTLEGPTQVEPGTVSTYTLTITGGQQTAGGLDVSATTGQLSVIDPGTYLRDGEITHSDPRDVDGTGAVVFSFNWTAPPTDGTAVLYGAGNSVNLGNGNGGDAPDSDVLAITVAAAVAGPGETSGQGLAPLLVTARDPSTGEMTLSYESGCESTSNNVYYGPLDQASAYGWSGETCAIGTGGTLSAFDPGAGSYFFVIVGTKAADEGSYGVDGAAAERLPYGSNLCGQQQALADRCD